MAWSLSAAGAVVATVTCVLAVVDAPGMALSPILAVTAAALIVVGAISWNIKSGPAAALPWSQAASLACLAGALALNWQVSLFGYEPTAAAAGDRVASLIYANDLFETLLPFEVGAIVLIGACRWMRERASQPRIENRKIG